ncbi:hypothetical protein ACFQZ4_42610 [Catellatospora coxensis]
MNAYPPPTPETLHWLHRAVGAPIAAVTPLVGGVAHAISAVDTADGRRYALRRWCGPAGRSRTRGSLRRTRSPRWRRCPAPACPCPRSSRWTRRVRTPTSRRC